MHKPWTSLAHARWLPFALLIACDIPSSALNEHHSIVGAVSGESADLQTVLLKNVSGANPCATVSTGLPIVPGAPVYLRECTGTAAQQFLRTNAGELRTWSGACLTGDEGTGDRVGTEICHGTPSQVWVIGRGGDWRSHRNKCLGVNDRVPVTGARLTVGSCRGATGQQWAMVNTAPAAPPPPAPTPIPVPLPPSLTRLVISPLSVTLPTGGVQRFSVSALWSDASTSVPLLSWSTTGGTVTNSGLFTAGTLAGNFQVTARQQGGSAYAVVSVTVTAPHVIAFAVSPKTGILDPAQTLQFSTSAVWSDGVVRPHETVYTVTGGSITGLGLFSAPSAAGSWLVIATCSCGLADTAEARVRAVTPPPPVLSQLSISPRAPTLVPGATQQFSVSALWSNGSSVAPPVSYTATGGTISSSGQYSAGSLLGTFRVVATYANGAKADTSVVTIAAPPTLRQYADARQFSMGAAVNMDALRADAKYQQVLASEYNSVVAEYVMNFSHIHPEANRYSFSDADQLLTFAQAHGMAVRGAPLVWHQLIPGWITGVSFTKQQLLAILKEHISTIVSRYRGKFISWDIVNEPISDDGLSLRNSWWLSVIGPEYIDSSFVWANRADPSAKLFLNDFGADAGGVKANAIFSLAQSLKARGVPVHGVAFQAHFGTASASTGDIKANLARFANAGFDVRVSEMDVQLPNAAGDAILADQAALYRDVLDACLRLSRCTGFTTWGFSDRYSWINAYFPGFGRALPFDANYQPKLAHAALLARLAVP